MRSGIREQNSALLPEKAWFAVAPGLVNACQPAWRHEHRPLPFVMAQDCHDMLRAWPGNLEVEEIARGEKLRLFSPEIQRLPDRVEFYPAIFPMLCQFAEENRVRFRVVLQLRQHGAAFCEINGLPIVRI